MNEVPQRLHPCKDGFEILDSSGAGKALGLVFGSCLDGSKKRNISK